MNQEINAYIQRSTKWPKELSALRSILLGCGLTEALKWGKPCYSHEGANIVILQEMKAFLSLMYFKGALLSDPQQVLLEQGPNSRSARRMEFTSVADVTRLSKVVKSYVNEALRIEADGLQLGPKPQLVLVEELEQRLMRDTVNADLNLTRVCRRRRLEPDPPRFTASFPRAGTMPFKLFLPSSLCSWSLPTLPSAPVVAQECRHGAYL